MLITWDLFFDYLQCKYKAYCKLNGKQETKTDYDILHIELDNDYRNKAVEAKFSGDDRRKNNNTFKYSDLKQGKRIIVDAHLETESFISDLMVLEKVSGISKLGNFFYIPVFFYREKIITKENKLCVAYNSFVLKQIQGRKHVNGKIIYDSDYKNHLFQGDSYLDEIKNIMEGIENLTIPNKEPTFSVIDYCRSCGFCKAYAAEKDYLSLLRGMNIKEIQKWNNKGIFTVTQLSYAFRPRKRNRRMLRFKQKHIFELKALAIREKKTLIYEKPQMPYSNVQIYVDIE